MQIHLPISKAKDELNETEERKVSSIKELRAMMKEKASEGDDLAKAVQEKFGDRPDSLLLRFIRARKFDVTRAHELMKGKVLYFIMASMRLHVGSIVSLLNRVIVAIQTCFCLCILRPARLWDRDKICALIGALTKLSKRPFVHK